MTSVLEKIVAWSSNRPLWQRDALRRLILQDQLSDHDIVELTQLCLAAHNAADTDKAAINAVPLTLEHVQTGEPGKRVRLAAVRDVRRVNALASGRQLSFSPTGLTAVYGDNGSGKSGYTRILKTVCRARGGSQKIYPNIFSDPLAESPTADIDYLLDETLCSYTWHDGKPGPEALGRISVFDSRCAAVYVEDKTDVAFRPFGLDLFPRLVQACERVKSTINAMIGAQGAARTFLGLLNESPVGHLLRDLSSHTAAQRLDRLATLSSDEQARLVKLTEVVAQIRANDPKRRAAELRLRAARFRSLLQHAERIEQITSIHSEAELRSAHQRAKTAAEAAQLASAGAFDEEPVRGVGTNAWQSLWLAALRFSTEEAYPGEEFPVVGADAACVLCHQPLENSASQRLLRFSEFVKQEAKRQQEQASSALEELLKQMREVVAVRASDDNVLAELLEYDSKFADDFKAYIVLLQTWLEALRSACETGGWEGVPALNNSPCAQLLTLIADLENTAADLERAGDQEHAAAVLREHAELFDREKLAKQKVEVHAEIRRQQRVEALKRALRDTDTKGITTKNTELTKTEVSDDLKRRFADELRALGLHHLTVSVEPENGAKGVMFHRITFDDAKTDGWGVQEVLSEGEHRCIALAAFLAELSMDTSGSAIILDDPVSSLDHRRRESVARRLVQESKTRPVIVLTHDVVFLLLLQEQTKEQKVDFTSRFLDRADGNLGVPVDGLPWYGMPLSKRIGWLRNEVVKLRKTFKNEDGEIYDRDCAFLWGRLREAWECGVEEVLLNGAVRRFGREISTKPLKSVHDITPDDVAAVETGMTACSTWLPGHDQSAELNTPLPDPEVLHKAVEALELWREAITKRRK